MLRFILHKYEEVKVDFSIITNELSNLALNFPIKKNVQDYIHLIIAREKQLVFLTLDKLDDQIELLQKNYYPYIYYWPDFKNLFPNYDPFPN